VAAWELPTFDDINTDTDALVPEGFQPGRMSTKRIRIRITNESSPRLPTITSKYIQSFGIYNSSVHG
jgi:hypothetical protein